MSTNNLLFHDKIRKFHKLIPNYVFLELSKGLCRDSKKKKIRISHGK